MTDLDKSLTNIEWLQSLGRTNNSQINEGEAAKTDVDQLARLTIQDTQIPEREQKPPYSYALMIKLAIQSSPDGMITLQDLYSYILKNYPYYQNSNMNWKNSIRHNLSLNKFFVKVPRPRNMPGKGFCWTYDPAAEGNRKKTDRKLYADAKPQMHQIHPKLKTSTTSNHAAAASDNYYESRPYISYEDSFHNFQRSSPAMIPTNTTVNIKNRDISAGSIPSLFPYPEPPPSHSSEMPNLSNSTVDLLRRYSRPVPIAPKTLPPTPQKESYHTNFDSNFEELGPIADPFGPSYAYTSSQLAPALSASSFLKSRCHPPILQSNLQPAVPFPSQPFNMNMPLDPKITEGMSKSWNREAQRIWERADPAIIQGGKFMEARNGRGNSAENEGTERAKASIPRSWPHGVAPTAMSNHLRPGRSNILRGTGASLDRSLLTRYDFNDSAYIFQNDASSIEDFKQNYQQNQNQSSSPKIQRQPSKLSNPRAFELLESYTDFSFTDSDANMGSPLDYPVKASPLRQGAVVPMLAGKNDVFSLPPSIMAYGHSTSEDGSYFPPNNGNGTSAVPPDPTADLPDFEWDALL